MIVRALVTWVQIAHVTKAPTFTMGKKNRDMTKIKINSNSILHPYHKRRNVKDPMLIYHYAFVFCCVPWLFVLCYLRVRISTLKQH